MRIKVYNEYEVENGCWVAVNKDKNESFKMKIIEDDFYEILANSSMIDDKSHGLTDKRRKFLKDYGGLVGDSDPFSSTSTKLVEERRFSMLRKDEKGYYIESNMDFIGGTCNAMNEYASLYEYFLKFSEFPNNKAYRDKLISQLNNLLFEFKVIEQLKIEADGQIKQSPIFENLFGVALWQLQNAILLNARVKRCKNCGRYFTFNRANELFCNTDIDKENRSRDKPCQNRYNQRKVSARRLYKEGVSVEKIAIRYSRSREEIIEWLGNC